MKEISLQTARNKETEERALRAELLKKQIAPEIQRTQGLVLQMQTSFMRLSQQVLDHVRSGKKISAAQRRAWRQTIAQLQSLNTADTEQFEKALEVIFVCSDLLKQQTSMSSRRKWLFKAPWRNSEKRFSFNEG